jgi:hypothetical protein
MKIILLFISSLSFICSSAQRSYSHTFFAEGGGATAVLSANYDFRFNNESHRGWGMRIGLGWTEGYHKIYFGSEYAYDVYGSKFVPVVGVNYLSASRNSPNAFEAGANLAYAPENSIYMSWGNGQVKERLLFSGVIGYRRQPLTKGFLWRADFTPMYLDGSILPVFGVSVGYKW